jgi:hypothetical protein
MAKAAARKSIKSSRALPASSSGETGAVAIRRKGTGLSSRIRRPRTAPRSIGTLGYALHKIPGGRKTFIEYARIAAASSDKVRVFVECYEDLSTRERDGIPLDQICIESAAITPAELLGEVVKAAFEFGQDVSALMAATCLPEVVGASIREAKKARGFKDRQALMQHSGFVPIPKSSTPPANIRNIVMVNAQANAQGGNGSYLPTSEEETMELTRIVRSEEDKEG